MGEEVDCDAIIVPFRGKDTAALFIEATPVSFGIRGRDATTYVGVLIRGVDIAVRGVDSSRERRAAAAATTGGIYATNAAARAGMEGKLVRFLVVGSFDDIDLAVVRPIGAYEPEGRPCAADATRHVVEVDDEKSRIVASFAGDTDAWTSTGSYSSVIDAHSDL